MTNLQEAADLSDTVAVSARRFEESPFILRQDTSKMVQRYAFDRYDGYDCHLSLPYHRQ